MIFNHQNYRALIEPEMPRRYPGVRIASLLREGRIKRRLESIWIRLCQFGVVNTPAEHGQRDLRRERQRRHYGPRCDGAVVRSVRYASPHVIEELPLDAVDTHGLWTRTFAGADSPAVAAVGLELERVVDRVLLLHICSAAAVLEIIDAFIAHEGVLNSAKVDPDMRELVCEQRPGVKILLSVNALPLVGGAPR